MGDIDQILKGVIEATRIHSETSYSWFGVRLEPLPRRLRRILEDHDTARQYLVSTLQAKLYRNFYCQGLPQPELPDYTASAHSSRVEFALQLSKANTGEGYWEAGWTVVRTDGSTVVITKSGLTLQAARDRVRLSPHEQLQPGAELAVHFSKEFFAISPGFYVAAGDVSFDRQEAENLVRLYWNLQSDGAAALMAAATRRLNAARLPFNLKVLNDPGRFDRCDAAVLCCRKTDFPSVVEIVAEVYRDVRPHLKTLIPAFTKQLAPGLGLAENPPGGESFGLHRCRILAEGIVRAREQNERGVHAILRTVEACFASAGIDLGSPYLNPGSDDEYDLGRRYLRACQPESSECRFGPDSFLEAAASLGWRLSADALWHAGRCNWVGSTTQDSRAAAHYQMLDSSLYSGASGVALFLAELYRMTEDAAFRKVAAGAIAQALDRVESEGAPAALGLYTGWPGTVLAAVRIGRILEMGGLIRRARRLIDRCIGVNALEGECDLMSGVAGFVITLIVLGDLMVDPSLLNLAEKFGRALIERADRAARGISWASPAFPNARNLTGFSHGAAGIAFALLELSVASGNTLFHQYMEEAFAYERFWFDERTRNWPDFRAEVKARGSLRRPLYHMTAWCHGAPGIALSRLRAHQLLGTACFQSEAVIALETTRRSIESCLAGGGGNLSLCHGLPGNAEVLLYGDQVLGTGSDRNSTVIRRVAEHVIRTCSVPGAQPHNGDVPGLMLGLAGVGYFYLRLSKDPPPSVLLPKREEWSITAASMLERSGKTRASTSS